MRSRVLPLDGGANATGARGNASRRRQVGNSGVAAASRSSARKGAKGEADSSRPVDLANKKPGQRGNKAGNKQQLAVIAMAAVCVGLLLSLTLLETLPPSLQRSLASPASDAEAVDRFLNWFRAAGGLADTVNVAAIPGMGKGIVARGNIREGDEMLFVPKDIIICADTIFKAPMPTKVLKKLRVLHDQEDELLTAFLVLEQLQGEASRWSPYLQLLPQMPLHMQSGHIDAESSASPLLYISDDHIEQLQDPHMVKTARDERSAVQRAFRRFKRLFGHLLSTQADGQEVSVYQYVWARFLVNSRAFSIRGRRFLVPFGDFFNGHSQQQARAHDNGRHFLKFHELQDAGMIIRADRDTLQAQQVFEDYGDNDNYIYFLYHGFLMPDNPFDCATVQLPPVASPESNGGDDTVFEMKTRVLRHFGVANGPSVCISADGSIREAPLAQFYSRLHRMSRERMAADCDRVEQYAMCFLDNDASKSIGGSTEGDSSMNMAQFFSNAVHDQLAAYPTTADHDERILQKLKMTTVDASRVIEANEHAIRFRLSRKRVLEAAMASLKQQIHDTAGKSDVDDHLQPVAGESQQPVAEDPIEISSSAEPSTPTNERATPTRESMDAVPTATSRHRDGRLERFQQWIQSLSFPVNRLELRYVNDVVGFGTFATKQLKEGDVYLRVPVDVVMNVRSAVQSPSRWLSQVSRALGSDQNADNWLTLHLLDEKFGPRRDQSRWKPYLDMLPSVDAGRMGSPLFYPQDGVEMELLARTDLLPMVENYQRRVLGTYEVLTKAIETIDSADGAQLAKWITLDRFLWATAVLDSRSIWWGGQRHLVPLLDMVNCRELAPDRAHKAHHTELAGENGQFADTRASWAFVADEEVVENYGQPNYIYLLYHGFVLEHNSHDCGHLRIDFAAAFQADKAGDVVLRRRVAAQLEPMGVYSWRWDVCVDEADAVAVAQFARMAPYATDPERALSREERHDGTDTSAVSREQAAAALALVQTRLDKLDAATAEQAEDCHRCAMVVTYMDQQQRHLRQLHDRLKAISDA